MAEVTKTVQKTKERSAIGGFLLKHIVTIIFIIICVGGIMVAKQSPYFLVSQILERISRNTFLVLALIIPVIAGMGLNFAIIIGAMAGQIAVIIASNFGIGGVGGMALVMLIAVPFAVLFGVLIGHLLNKTRGQEMITSLIVGYFANGVYQFIFLFLAGTLIPIANEKMLISNGIGLRNTVDMSGLNKINDSGLTSDGLKYSIDGLWKMGIYNIIFLGSLLAFAFALAVYFRKPLLKLFKAREGGLLYNVLTPNEMYSHRKQLFKVIFWGLLTAVAFAIEYLGMAPESVLELGTIKFPLVTAILIGLVALFNVIISSTKLGQDFRTVGQDQHVAKVSGINIDKTRVIAITISMVLAAWGQIVLLQNVGVLNTYGSHMQVGLFSAAALLVGGASVTKATNGQAFLGVLLFHTLFLVSPTAGKNLFNDPQIGEFFRAFVAYGVIGVSLGLYAWKRAMSKGEL